MSPATRRTLRTNLRALARAVAEHPEPLPVALSRERAKAPYSETEIAGYLASAAAQSTLARVVLGRRKRHRGRPRILAG